MSFSIFAISVSISEVGFRFHFPSTSPSPSPSPPFHFFSHCSFPLLFYVFTITLIVLFHASVSRRYSKNSFTAWVLSLRLRNFCSFLSQLSIWRLFFFYFAFSQLGHNNLVNYMTRSHNGNKLCYVMLCLLLSLFLILQWSATQYSVSLVLLGMSVYVCQFLKNIAVYLYYLHI